MNIEIWNTTITFYITTLALYKNEKKALITTEVITEVTKVIISTFEQNAQNIYFFNTKHSFEQIGLSSNISF